MLLRNRKLRRALLAATLILAAGAIATGALVNTAYLNWGPDAATWIAVSCVLACGAALVVLFALVTRRRYRELRHMAERVDDALHSDRTVSLADMREGELAILASEVDKALTRLTLTAEELTREKGSLADSLADISHQLRTPLTSLGLTLALARKEAGPHASGELLEHLRTSERLLAQVQWLVEALLKLARIDAGTVRLRKEPVDVDALVAAAAEPLAIPFDLADVRLVREVAPGTHFTGDEAWTREALENVLKNCLEHTSAGGEVRVVASSDAVACRISVTDTGPGISAEDLPHVFERFYRGKAPVDRELGNTKATGADGPGATGNVGRDVAAASGVNPVGVGIGLSLAQSLITAQDGRITAGNVLDAHGRAVGARFDITFFRAVV